MTPQVFIIVCHDKETDIFEELSGAYVSRDLAEQAKKNLNLNFPSYEHTIKPLSLQGAINVGSNNCTYCFTRNRNE